MTDSAPSRHEVAIAHDYLTQRGGAERVVLDLAAAFPNSLVYTSLYQPSATFPEFEALDIAPLILNRSALLRRHHRLAFPLLAPAFSALHLHNPVVVCSSSGWAHGVHVEGRKVVYCHTPARWLYQTDRYLGDRHRWARWPIEATAVPLRAWDRRAAHSADRYLVNSSVVRDRVAAVYGIEAELLPPPPGLDVEGAVEPVSGIDEGFVLCISRLLEYKNVTEVVDAFRRLPGQRLVVAGAGPLLASLTRSAPPNVRFTGVVPEAQLRWLYRSCAGVVAASHEDFGLTPLEGCAFGKPTAALRWGGYLDTVREGETGLFFDAPEAEPIARAVSELLGSSFIANELRAHAATFSRARFIERMRTIVSEELRGAHP